MFLQGVTNLLWCTRQNKVQQTSFDNLLVLLLTISVKHTGVFTLIFFTINNNWCERNYGKHFLCLSFRAISSLINIHVIFGATPNCTAADNFTVFQNRYTALSICTSLRMLEVGDVQILMEIMVNGPSLLSCFVTPKWHSTQYIYVILFTCSC